MTVGTGGRAASYLIVAGVTSYVIPFALAQAADLRAYEHPATAFDPAAPGVLLTEGVHYTLNEALSAIAPTDLFPDAGTLTLYRYTTRAQTAAYTPNDGFPAEAHEAQLDRLSLVDQEQDDSLAELRNRALLAAAGETIAALPAAADRAGKVLFFDPLTAQPKPTALPIAALTPDTANLIGARRGGLASVPANVVQNLLDLQPVDLRELKLPGETDWSNAIDRATALGPGPIIVPPSTDGLPIVRPFTDHALGNRFLGHEGAQVCKFLVDPTAFAAGGALGVRTIPSTASERYAGGDGVGFCFVQPAGRTRATLAPVPAAVYANGVSRMSWGHLKTEGATDGLHFVGNCGGLLADKLELGVMGVGLTGGGSYDWWDIGDLTIYPWGIAHRADLSAIYYDGVTIGAHLTRIDGLNVDKLNLLCAQLVTDADANGIYGFGQIGILNLDSDGARWDKTGGHYQVGTAYLSKTVNGSYTVAHHGPVDSSLVIGSAVINSAAAQHCFLDDSNGFTSIGGGYVQFQAPGYSTFYNTAGVFHLEKMFWGAQHLNQARTAPMIDILGGRCSILHPRVTDKGTGGAAALLRIYNDDFHDVVVNAAPGWSVTLPAKPSAGFTGTYMLNGVRQ